MQSEIERVGPEHKNYGTAVKAAVPKNNINYRELARKIGNSKPGDIIQVKSTRENYTNIKRGLYRRKLIFGTHYSLNFSTETGEDIYFITVSE